MKLTMKRLPSTIQEADKVRRKLETLRNELGRELNAKGRLLEMQRQKSKQLKRWKQYAKNSRTKREKCYYSNNLPQWGRVRQVLNLLQYMENEKALAWSKASGDDRLMTYEWFERIAIWVAKWGVTAEELAQAGVSGLTLIPKAVAGEWRPLLVPSHYRKALEYCLYGSLLEAVQEHEPKDSYAYRPNLSALDGAEDLAGAIADGFTEISNEDLTGAFDHICRGWIYGELLRIGVQEQWATLLIASLNIPIENHSGKRAWKNENGGHDYVKKETPEGKVQKVGTIYSNRGIAQGGVLSPTLFNLGMNALHRLARAWGFRIIRYADDYAIAAKSRAELERAIRLVSNPLRLAELSRNEKKCWKSQRVAVMLGYTITAENVMPNMEWMRGRSNAEETQVLDTCVTLAEHLKATDLTADWYGLGSNSCLISPYVPNCGDIVWDFLIVPTALGSNYLSYKWVLRKELEYTDRKRYFSSKVGSETRHLYIDDSTSPPSSVAEIVYRKIDTDTLQYIVDVLSGYYGIKALAALNNNWMVGKPLLPIKSTVEGFIRPTLVRPMVISGKLGYYFKPGGLRVRGLWSTKSADEILCRDKQRVIAEMQVKLDAEMEKESNTGIYTVSSSSKIRDTTPSACSRSAVTQCSISHEAVVNSTTSCRLTVPNEEGYDEVPVAEFIGYVETIDEELYGKSFAITA